ncbi:MAG: hypothetical protein J6U05_07595 [Neisseriaceae bacterium]|nr:hypothetical protein [Neisseriaceae bacterium]
MMNYKGFLGVSGRLKKILSLRALQRKAYAISLLRRINQTTTTTMHKPISGCLKNFLPCRFPYAGRLPRYALRLRSQ